MPFRLTRQFINLMMPVKEWGLIYSVMVHALRAYREDPDLLISTMDVFVKEPSLDWKVGFFLFPFFSCENSWNCSKDKTDQKGKYFLMLTQCSSYLSLFF